jgi:ligand-binding sensor domain-containing protein/two-component sensor histidine kinase
VIKKVIHIIFILLFFAFSNAQEPIRYSVKQGLPSNHIYDLEEDANGFMWFATNRGLVKFDGETFKIFTIRDGLPNNDTWRLETDLKGRLWYYSKSSDQGYIKNDSIYKFSTEKKEIISPTFTYKTKDSLWFFNSNKGLKTFNKTNIIAAEFTKVAYPIILDNLEKIHKRNGFDIKKSMPLHNPENKEFIFISKTKALIYNKSLKFIKEIPLNVPVSFDANNQQNRGLMYHQIAFFEMEKGILLINCNNYKATYKSFKEMVGVENAMYVRTKSLKNEFQVSIPGHLMIFDYNLKLKNTYSFSEHLSRASYKDRKGNIWLIDFTYGLSILPKSQVFTKYYQNNNKIQKINSIKGSIYAGLNEKGFYKLDEITDQFLPIHKFNKIDNGIYQIKEDLLTNLNYFITDDISYNIKKFNFEQLKFKTNHNQYNFITAFKDITQYRGTSYIITTSSLLKSENPLKPAIVIADKSGLLFVQVFKEGLYVAGSNGLYKLKNESLIKPQIKNDLLNTSISSITANKHFLIAGTDGRGVYLYDEKKVIHLKNTDGFSIQKAIQKNNFLWIATNNGVHKVALDTTNLSASKIVNSFYDTDGLLQNNINDIYLEKDILYAATDIGISKINTKDTLYQQKPKLYFKTKSDTLIYKNEARDNIAITFGLQDYVNQNYIKYEYKLLPLQNKWTTTKTKNLNFSNLSPNLYQLQVKATDQHFNEIILSQYLEIVPKWWQTTTAKISFSLFGLLCFLGILKGIKIQIQIKERAKAQLDEKIAGLQLQALRSQMNPHFVHNSLNAIQYFIQRNEVELSENYLSKFSMLIRLFFEYSRRQDISLKEEIELLNNYLEIEKLRFEEKLVYQIKVDENLDVEEMNIPSMILQPIVENSVNHGLFHKKENGKITISFMKIDENSYEVQIIDDGIGIKKTKEIYKNSSKNYRSNSTEVLKERLNLLEQSKMWKINYLIIDLSEKENKEGTLVSISFKKIM